MGQWILQCGDLCGYSKLQCNGSIGRGSICIHGQPTGEGCSCCGQWILQCGDLCGYCKLQCNGSIGRGSICIHHQSSGESRDCDSNEDLQCGDLHGNIRSRCSCEDHGVRTQLRALPGNSVYL